MQLGLQGDTTHRLFESLTLTLAGHYVFYSTSQCTTERQVSPFIWPISVALVNQDLSLQLMVL